jgi:ATP-dependent DNA ligase
MSVEGQDRRPLGGGLDWTKRFPWIAETAGKIRKTQFVIDGEAVVLGVDGIADFNALHSRKHEVQLYAFDILALDGEDLRDQRALTETLIKPAQISLPATRMLPLEATTNQPTSAKLAVGRSTCCPC